ncbi:low affinity immunoglobulin gamma Fc region receptor III-like [Acridotheres tristis]
MPCPCPAVPSPVVALAGWCPLSPAGVQTPQILVEPPWRPAVLWDRVTLTYQGLGTAGATTWYKGGWLWWQKGPKRFVVNESGTYTCGRPGSGLSLPVRVLNERLVLQLPARALLEGDTVTLRCRGWHDGTVTGVRFYHGDRDLGWALCGTQLSLSPLQLHHSGRYRCGGWVNSGPSPCWEKSAPVTVTVHVAAGLGGFLLFLILLVGAAVGWHQCHNKEEGEVLYTHVVITKQMGVAVSGPAVAQQEQQLQTCCGAPEEPWQCQQGAPAFLNIHGEFSIPKAAVPGLKEEKAAKG